METNVIYNEDCIGEDGMCRLPDNSIDLIVTDPPYKTTTRGCSGGTGGMLKTELSMQGKIFENNDITPEEYLPKLYRVLKPKGHCYIMTNDKNLLDFMNAVEKSKFNRYKNLIWRKNTAITNMFYMDDREYILFCYKGKAKKINNCGTRTTIDAKNPRNKVHDTQKPIKLMKILIENSSKKGDIILDPFMGSCSTAIACIQTNRRYIGYEIGEKEYKDGIKRLGEYDKSYYDELPEEEKPKQKQLF